MAFFENLFNAQPKAETQPQAPQQQQQQQQQPTSTQQAVNANPTVPNQNNFPLPIDPATGQQMQSPLDNFADIWKTTPNTQQQEGFTFNSDPTKFMEAAQQINFAQVISPENLQKITAGGEEAVKALSQVLNQMAQTTYAQSALANTKIMEAAFSKYGQHSESKMQDMIRKFSVSDTIKTDNPAYSHPAMQPIVGALEAQLTSKYPNASNAQIKDMVGQYMKTVAGVFNPTPASDQTSSPGANTDWAQFMGN